MACGVGVAYEEGAEYKKWVWLVRGVWQISYIFTDKITTIVNDKHRLTLHWLPACTSDCFLCVPKSSKKLIICQVCDVCL